MNAVKFSLDDYDSIGFDLDCTIAEYNCRNLLKLVYDLLAKYLIEEKNYASKFLLDPFEESYFFLQKGLFMDLKKGNVLKINKKGVIIKAVHGTRVLSDDKILDQYGRGERPNVFKDLVEDPLSIINPPYEKMFRATLDCFDMPCILLFARLVDQLDEQKGGASDEYNIWPDILSGLYHLYCRNHFGSGESKFFSELKNNPSLYYKKWTQEKLDWLKEVKSRKFVYLLTGSYIDFASLTASYCLGENWKDYFDVVLCYARKPFFFKAGHTFLKVEDAKEGEPVESKDLQINRVYSQGNWKELNSFISRQINVKQPKCLYIGDNIIQDVYAPVHFECCHSVAVSLELKEEFKSSELWGSYFQGDREGTSYWHDVINNHAKVCVSGLDVFCNRPLSFQYHSIQTENTDLDESNGYYTN